MDRVVAHIDFDAFFASIHQRDNPELKGKAIAVGSTERRGVVATASYEARKYGIGSAMPSYRAKELYPDIIFVKPDMEAYKKASRKSREIFKQYSDIIQFASIDEAYLDLTEDKKNISDKRKVGELIKQDVKEQIGVTVSVGIAKNKFLAKVASDMDKPDGLTIIEDMEVDALLQHLPVGKFRGIGKKTVPKLESMGITTGGHLRELSLRDMEDIFGKKRSVRFYEMCRGIDKRPVSPGKRERKSIGISETFQYDVKNDLQAINELKKISKRVLKKMDMYGLYGRTITVKIKYSDFTVQTRSVSGTKYFTNERDILRATVKLLTDNPLKKPVRLFGISFSNLSTKKFEI